MLDKYINDFGHVIWLDINRLNDFSLYRIIDLCGIIDGTESTDIQAVYDVFGNSQRTAGCDTDENVALGFMNSFPNSRARHAVKFIGNRGAVEV